MAIIALLLATGLREDEVTKLEIDDLYHTYGGVPALRVKSGSDVKFDSVQILAPFVPILPETLRSRS